MDDNLIIVDFMSLGFNDPNISSIINNSDQIFTRCRIIFKNSYRLSILKELWERGSEIHFELALFDKDNKWVDKFFSTQILRYQTKEQVLNYIDTIGNADKIGPIQTEIEIIE